jgi:hypothetical protein
MSAGSAGAPHLSEKASAKASSAASAPKPATIWTPIGSRSLETATGKLIAGRPAMFTHPVNTA